MPRCYHFAVCRSSSLDHYTNTWSLFHLVETCRIRGDVLSKPEKPVELPLEVHAFWLFSENEYGVEFESRIVFAWENQTVPQTKVWTFRAQTPRLRQRLQGVTIRSVGPAVLSLEWRRKGEEAWNSTEVGWPLLVQSVATLPTEATLSLSERTK